MKKIIITALLLGACAFGGLMLYVPTADADYPADCTVEEYGENIQKNCDLMTQQLEEINQPTLKESLSEYQNIADTIDFYPTSIDTLEKATLAFEKEDQWKLFKDWRLERFIDKNYPNALEFQNQFEAQAHQSMHSGELPNQFTAKPYTYKDGSVINYSVGGMSVEYAQ